jgi:hypothetical protein
VWVASFVGFRDTFGLSDLECTDNAADHDARLSDVFRFILAKSDRVTECGLSWLDVVRFF